MRAGCCWTGVCPPTPGSFGSTSCLPDSSVLRLQFVRGHGCVVFPCASATVYVSLPPAGDLALFSGWRCCAHSRSRVPGTCAARRADAWGRTAEAGCLSPVFLAGAKRLPNEAEMISTLTFPSPVTVPGARHSALSDFITVAVRWCLLILIYSVQWLMKSSIFSPVSAVEIPPLQGARVSQSFPRWFVRVIYTPHANPCQLHVL